MNLIPIVIIFVPIITACIIYLVHRPWITALGFLCQGFLTLTLFRYSQFVQQLGLHELGIGGWPAHIGIGLRNDRLSMAFLWLTILFWTIILLYIWAYRKRDYKFLFFLFFLEGAFLGLLQSNDIFSFFIFVDITTILSTILIIYEKNGYAIKSGVFYLLFNSVGMLFYQLGFIFLYTAMGTLNITILTERIATAPHSNLLLLSYLFFLVAVGVKSAIFPVYTWLPRAHSAAPSAISALLSGLLVKSGLYAFLRMQFLFSAPHMNDFFFWLGLVSAISGVIFAISQSHLKQLLAYSTVSQIGLITMGLSQPNSLLYMGGITHLFNHAIFKSLLFLCAGVIIHRTGKKKLCDIKGILSTMPWLSAAMIIGMLALSGGFLTNGYLSKSLLLYGLEGKPAIATLAFHFVNLGTIIYLLKLSQIFFGHAAQPQKPIVLGQRLAITILATTCLVLPWFKHDLWAYFGLSLPHISLFTLEKAIIYGAQLAIGFWFVKRVIRQEPKFMRSIRNFQFGFGSSNALMLLFLILMIVSANLY